VGGEKKNIVVIGGGVTGVLTALFLAHAGHRVTLLEKNSLGSGSSQRSAACIRQQFGTPSTVRGIIYATRFFKNWEKKPACRKSLKAKRLPFSL
jgi:glycine/D-amino acid oxidase-like deaminating enzyme